MLADIVRSRALGCVQCEDLADFSTRDALRSVILMRNLSRIGIELSETRRRASMQNRSPIGVQLVVQGAPQQRMRKDVAITANDEYPSPHRLVDMVQNRLFGIRYQKLQSAEIEPFGKYRSDPQHSQGRPREPREPSRQQRTQSGRDADTVVHEIGGPLALAPSKLSLFDKVVEELAHIERIAASLTVNCRGKRCRQPLVCQ